MTWLYTQLKGISPRRFRTITLSLLIVGLLLSAAIAGDYIYVEKTIGPEGGKVNAQGDKLIVPEGALTEDTLISMEMTSDGISRVDYEFGPHGLIFQTPVELLLSWSSLKDVTSSDLVLYYYNDVGEWVEETHAIWDDNGKKARLSLDHFSKYYFERR